MSEIVVAKMSAIMGSDGTMDPWNIEANCIALFGKEKGPRVFKSIEAGDWV